MHIASSFFSVLANTFTGDHIAVPLRVLFLNLKYALLLVNQNISSIMLVGRGTFVLSTILIHCF